MDYSTDTQANPKPTNHHINTLNKKKKKVLKWHCVSLQEKNETTSDAAPKKKPSQLDEKIQSLLELICDLKAMEECVLEMKFDTRKAPLGQSHQISIAALTY